MAGRRNVQVVMATTSECSGKTFPPVEAISDLTRLSYDDIEEKGRKFMQYLSEHCSGTFVRGMRKYMLENQITVTYGDDDDTSDAEDK